MNSAELQIHTDTERVEEKYIREDRKLRKDLGIVDLFLIGITGVIGSGWLFAPLYAARVAGPASIISWAIGGVLVLLVGLTFSHLMGFRTEAGGMVRYPIYTHGKLAGSITGWALWLAYTMNPPSEASALVEYMSSYVPGVFHSGTLTPEGMGIALGFMFLFVLVNYYGVKIFARIINGLTALKLVVPTVTMLTLILLSFRFRNFTVSGFYPYGLSSVLAAIVSAGIVYSYLGFQAVINLAGESKRPARDGPTALILVIIFSLVFYIALEITFIGSVPSSFLRHGWSGLFLASPFADIALYFNLTWLYSLIIADSIYSPSGSSMAAVASNSRATYALAKDGFFPSFFVRIDGKTGIPRIALIFNFVISAIVLLTLKSWHSIIEALGVLLLISFIGPAASSGVIRRTSPENQILKGLYGVVQPAIFVMAGIIIFITPFTKIDIVIALFSIPAVLLILKEKNFRNVDLGYGIWLPVYLIIILSFSFLHTYYESLNILVPITAFVFLSLFVYIIAVRAGISFMKSGKQKE
ncbi:cationic amino acid transporter 3 (HCAT3) related protein [Thermoplasma acidophilum]|uniref:Cationic amino acid transporter 3 (HCAT3) related protein n=1 Tax=Thermoplasma acidophilum (strain ATCC 25905 / DSM 1728 / JCM 9062 / NBRC 15155 / AMRC-C165) TaxID=273075 RepID=Q9HLS7_THEAC|nr:APC family permease [Thermoplasma acidophilum]MCY0851142.1 APC family permease [Thermoplasma acidophilum]CAC11295.1 cationic amino acid transporter 3 (HCAT3) related protein [Thermoplasma acidophilum]